MSKQLAISAALSIFTMASFALLGSEAVHTAIAATPLIGLKAQAVQLPALGQLLPSLF
ncbi:MAG TPA: hypothetical protein VHG29_02105 [Novosphingobium sp.]|nr:hypothetical protein [Novosphingobium sp.]